MRKAEVTLKFLITGIIAVFILGVVFLYPPVMDFIAGKLPRILPFFNDTQKQVSQPEIIRYNIAEDKVQYYDELNWYDFPYSTPQDWSTKVKVGKKEITHNQARWNFEKYYYDKELRPRELKKIPLQDPYVIGVITGLTQIKNRGSVEISLTTEANAKQYVEKVYLIHDTIKLPITSGFIEADRSIFLRFNGKSWEWAEAPPYIGWSYTGKEKWEEVSTNSNYSQSPLLTEIIRNLAKKDFESGRQILLQKIADNPETFIYNGGDTEFGELTKKLIDKIYLKYTDKWYWSADNQEWIDVANPIITPDLKQTSGPYIEIRNLWLISDLREKNLEEGKKIIIESKELSRLETVNRILAAKLKLLKGIYTLFPDDRIFFEEYDESSRRYKSPTGDSQILAKKYEPLIKEGAIAWRDSVLKNPMCFCYDNKKCELLKVEKLSAHDNVYLVADLSKLLGACTQ